MSQEDKQLMLSVKKTTRFEDRHYYVGLPLRYEAVKMPNDHCVAEQRAASLKKKLRKNAQFLEDYKVFMKSILDNGNNLDRNDDRIWYVPHHGVYHLKKKEICVVFDCTASFQNVSLNG